MSMDNDDSVSNGTRTVVEILGDRIMNRYKMYNQLFSQFSSPGVSNTTGNHLHDVLACPDKRLKEQFNNPRAKLRGITRLEIKMCRNTIPSTTETETILNKLYNVVYRYMYYNVPVSTLWRNIAEHRINHLIVVNRKTLLLYIAYYVNPQTRKMTGNRINMDANWKDYQINNCINYVISKYSYNTLPCYLLDIDNRYKEDYEKHRAKCLANKKIKS